ncbi:VF530 family DNA-binding protein [Motiliproteus sp.]|uniref:VF530 family protein n=1 Tax=Motiliproteus sp. TaxID=1898955 RepID=UPI003BABCE80
MNDEINYRNNPLHGLGLKALVTELVDHYGFEILYAYLNINCFRTNPSVASSVKFLKKTDWAREKVETFYLYQFKNLPRASSTQFKLPPRERIIPDGQLPGEPAELSLEDAAHLNQKKRDKAASWNKNAGYQSRKKPQQRRQSPFSKSTEDKPSEHANASEPKPKPKTKPQSSDQTFNPWSRWEKK